MRKILSLAFGEKAFREREGIIQRYLSALVGKLKELKGKPIDALEWYDILTTDITTQFAFWRVFSWHVCRALTRRKEDKG